jgi:choice-of-anchor A domain-containing protein
MIGATRPTGWLSVGKGKLILIALLAIFRTSCSALPVNLGNSGPAYWTILEVGSGMVEQKVDLSNPQGTLLNQARFDAIAASAAASALTPISAVPAAVGGPGKIAFSKQSLVLAPGIYNLTKFQLNHATLTLSGTSSDNFVFNISDTFALSSAQVQLAGGATEANVLFNYTGTRDVAFSGRGNASVLHGIILALNAKVNLAPGLVVGEIISGEDISLSSGAMIQNLAARIVSVPEGASTFLLSLIALGALIAFRSFVLHSSSRAAPVGAKFSASPKTVQLVTSLIL